MLLMYFVGLSGVCFFVRQALYRTFLMKNEKRVLLVSLMLSFRPSGVI